MTSDVEQISSSSLIKILVQKHKAVENKIIDLLQLHANETEEHLSQLLLEEEILNENDLLQAFSQVYEIPFKETIPFSELNPQLVKNLSIQFCQQYLIIPLYADDFSVTLAVNNPYCSETCDALQTIVKKQVTKILCPKSTIEAAINSMFERLDLSDQNQGNLSHEEEVDDIEGLDVAQDLLQNTDEAPVRKEVSTIIRRGITEKASDIHIEPFEDRVSVRFRIDGRLKEVRIIPKKYQSSVSTRIKILAKLNIAESRIPQDGRITLRVGSRNIDLRVSTLPIKFGERIVLRILDKSGGLPELDKIGMPSELLKTFKNLVQQQHGIVLVTGPTGSGKTTTLASALMSINKPDVSIITVEDPVEIQLPGVCQVEVNERAGLSFAAALRSILRQNPNIILIGEIRDAETAKIAVQASITGHLVFSTLHTNDTASSVTRLVDFGIESFQITTAVLGILAVRLIRRLCRNCKEETIYNDEQLNLLGISSETASKYKVYKAHNGGCNECRNTGYSGRLGIYELLVFDEEIRTFVLNSSDGASLKRLCMSRGMKTLRDSAQERFLQGDTSLEEALYGTQEESHS